MGAEVGPVPWLSDSGYNSGGAALLRPSTLSSVLGGVLLLCLTSEGFARPQVESLELDHSGAEASAAVMTW